MKKILILSFLLVAICGINQSAFALFNDNPIMEQETQLEKRAFQTRIYNNISKVIVMKAMLNVLQDEGFIIDNANQTLGYISGSKEFSTKDKTIDIAKEFGFSKAKLSLKSVKFATIEATANATESGNDMKVRVNFKRKLLNQYGNVQDIDDIKDSEYYQVFFAKVDKAMFIQKQKI